MQRIHYAIVGLILLGIVACGETERRVEVPIAGPEAEGASTGTGAFIDWPTMMKELGAGSEGGRKETTIEWENEMYDESGFALTTTLEEKVELSEFLEAYEVAEKLNSFLILILNGVPPKAQGLSGKEREEMMAQYWSWIGKYQAVLLKLMVELKNDSPDKAKASEMAKFLADPDEAHKLFQAI